MAWNRTTREQYKREAVRYESDLTDAEWELIEPLIPKQVRMGRPRERDLREVFNRVQYQLATGCQWRALPNCFAPYSTVQNYFYNWRDSGLFDRMMEALWALAGAGTGRNLEPTAAILDSQSVKATDPKSPSLSGGPRVYDGAKKIKGRKHQLAVDVEGSPLAIQIHEASVQDRDSAPPLILELLAKSPTVKKLFADGGYAGPKLAGRLKKLGLSELIEIVVKPKGETRRVRL